MVPYEALATMVLPSTVRILCPPHHASLTPRPTVPALPPRGLRVPTASQEPHSSRCGTEEQKLQQKRDTCGFPGPAEHQPFGSSCCNSGHDH